MKTQSTARILVTVEVQSGPYGDDWTGAKMFEDAGRCGVDTVRAALSSRPELRIVGEPVVKIVTSEVKP